MSQLPRVALGTVQNSTDPSAMLWALVGLLRGQGQQVQIFHDRAAFTDAEGDRCICGQNSRYLDSWLMSRELCRESFVHGSSGCDLAIVAGRYQGAPGGAPIGGAASLEVLCDWLDLPRLAVIDVSRLSECLLPPRPEGATGLLLDRVSDDDFFRWQSWLEALWGIPVLGGLPELPELRRAVHQFGCKRKPCEVCLDLAGYLARTLRLPKLLDVATERRFIAAAPRVFRPGDRLAGMTVAVAYDEAFHCYFPDVLDLLDLQGARVETFSPLRDEGLPPGSDIVYFGCGCPERHARALAENHCMVLALRSEVCRGTRVYAEGGGLAYLSQHISMPSGEVLPMTGLLPASALFHPNSDPAAPQEVTLGRETWLGRSGWKLRGYLNRRWQIERLGPLTGCVAEPAHLWDIACHQQVIGSRLHINFAVQPNFLRRFAGAEASRRRAAGSRQRAAGRGQ